MPTPPHPHVLPLERLPSDIEEIITELTSKLEEVRNFGTYVFAWVGQTPPPESLRLAPMLLFRHALEQLDAICILVKNHSPDAAMVNLRALMETWLYIWYITETDTDRRAAAYLVWYYHERQKSYRQYLPEEESGREFQKHRADDLFMPNLSDRFPFDELRDSIANIDVILKQPEYVQMESHYQTLMGGSKGQRPRSWYQLAGGPSDIRGLARDLRVVSMYVGFYKTLSGVIHSSDIMQGRIASSNREGRGAFKQLRLLSNLNFVTHMAILWSNDNYQHLIGRYAPSKASEIKRWYSVEMREFVMQKLPTLNITHT